MKVVLSLAEEHESDEALKEEMVVEGSFDATRKWNKEFKMRRWIPGAHDILECWLQKCMHEEFTILTGIRNNSKISLRSTWASIL